MKSEKLSHIARPLITYHSSLITLGLLPMVGFFVYFFALRYNIPWFDDYENIPFFLQRFLDGQSLTDRAEALLRPNNEHRVVYARLVVLAQYALTGKLHFGNLMLVGNLSLVVIFCLLYRALRWEQNRVGWAVPALLPVSLLLFNAQNYVLTFTAVFSLQYLAIIMLAMLTFYALSSGRAGWFGVAVGLGLLSTFSMGNGMMVWPAGVGMLLLQRRWRGAGLWMLLGGLSIWLYFWGYPVQQGNAQGFQYILEHPFSTLAGVCVLAGSLFDLLPTLPIQQRIVLPFILGLLVLTGLAVWFYRLIFRKPRSLPRFDAYVAGCLLFLLISITLIAFFRMRFTGFLMVVHNSYRCYALALWSLSAVLLYREMVDSLRARVWPVVYGGVLLLYVASWVSYLPLAVERRKHMQGMTFNQRYDNVGLGGSRITQFLSDFITDRLRVMHDRGWYDLPDPAITPDERNLLRRDHPAVAGPPFKVLVKPDYVVVSTNEPDYRFSMNSGTYLVMQSDRYTYVMFAEPNRPSLRRFWWQPPGFSGAMPTYMIEAGHYRIGWFHTRPDRSEVQFTDQYVDVR